MISEALFSDKTVKYDIKNLKKKINAYKTKNCPNLKCKEPLIVEQDLSYNDEKNKNSFFIVNVEFSESQPKIKEIKEAFDRIPFSFPTDFSKKMKTINYFLIGIGCEGAEGVNYYFRRKEEQAIFYEGNKSFHWEEVIKESCETRAKPFVLIYFL